VQCHTQQRQVDDIAAALVNPVRDIRTSTDPVIHGRRRQAAEYSIVDAVLALAL
jgi:hypothetical protein